MSNPRIAAELVTELAAERQADRVRGRLMSLALKQLLDQVKGARAALPHLAALEEALGRRGAVAIDEIPLQWLGRITQQLGSLPMREADHELQDLLTRLCKAVERHQQPAIEGPQFLSNFNDDERMEVRELSHSAFIEEFGGAVDQLQAKTSA